MQLLAEGHGWQGLIPLLIIALVVVVIVALFVLAIVLVVIFSFAVLTAFAIRKATGGRSAILWTTHLGRSGIALLVASVIIFGMGVLTLLALEVQRGGLVTFLRPLEHVEIADHPEVRINRALTIAAGTAQLVLAGASLGCASWAIARATRDAKNYQIAGDRSENF